MSIPLPDRLAGAVWGHLVGDALGVPYEFRDAAAITSVEWGVTGTHGQPPGTWSDDGSLMLALLDSLLEAGFDAQDQGRRAVAWFRQGAYAPGGKTFDWGGTTKAAIEAIERGVPALEAGPAGERDCGNGSLMRILPLALVERGAADERLIELAHRASRVTHGHPRCQVACAWYSLIVRRLLAGTLGRVEALADARAVLRATYEGRELAAHLVALDELEAWTGRSGRGFVLDSFWSAWDAFAAADSYPDAVIRAVRNGNDTDTTAAIAGGLAGAWFGIDAIPADWRAGLRDPAVVQPLVDRLVDDHRMPPPSLPALAAFASDFADPPASFGEWRGGDRTETGAIQMPWVEYDDWADRFRRACAEGGWVRPDIDWPAWAQTPDAQRLRDDPDAMSTATVHDLARLLTAIIRSDRFSEGSFLGAYESGLLRRIVARAAELERGRQHHRPGRVPAGPAGASARDRAAHQRRPGTRPRGAGHATTFVMHPGRDQEALEALAAFAPVFADPEAGFGTWVSVEASEGETGRLPYVELTELAERFLRTCAEQGWVRLDLDWSAWSATPEAQRLQRDPEALAAATSDDLARLLTTLVRGDLFDDGRLLWAFETGLLLRITERAAVLARAGDLSV